MKKLILLILLISFLTLKIQATSITFDELSPNVEQILSSGTYDNITINRGAFVVCDQAIILLNEPGQIRINEGGVLKITKSKIVQNYQGIWLHPYGILVMGDPNYEQDPTGLQDILAFNSVKNILKQGLLLFDHSKILWCKYGIHAFGSGYIKINTSTFQGNSTCILMVGYTKFHQQSKIDYSIFVQDNVILEDAYIVLRNASISANTGSKWGTNGYQALTISYCRFEHPGVGIPIVEQYGIHSIGSFVNIKHCIFQKMSIGFLSEPGIGLINNSGAFVSESSRFLECDRGIVSLGASRIMINGCEFTIPRKATFTSSKKLTPASNPLGIFIAGATFYYISQSTFEFPFGSSTSQLKQSFGIIVDNNFQLGANLINNNLFSEVDIGVQSQNEFGCSFLRCNDFGGDFPGFETFNFDITVPKGFLRQHNGCSSIRSTTFNISGQPGNLFSTNATSHSERNISIQSNDFPAGSGKFFEYSFSTANGASIRLGPQFNTPVKVNLSTCPNLNGCEEQINTNNNFTYNYESYIGASSTLDSLLTNNADTGDVAMGDFYKTFFLNEIVSSITDSNQLDSAIGILRRDTSLLSSYHLLTLFLASQEFDSAQSLLDYHISGESHEANNIKSLYNILIPIYRNYVFDSLHSLRNTINSIAEDSGFIAKQAQYIVNYIDETQSEIDSVEDFMPIYTDSIIILNEIDTSVTIRTLYEINVYPNPFTTNISADFTNNSGITGHSFTMKIFNSYGELKGEATESINDAETKTLNIDTTELELGFYYLQFLDATSDAIVGYRLIYQTQ